MIFAHPVNEYLVKLHQKFQGLNTGEVASYIPELALANAKWFGMAIVTIDGHVYQQGDTRINFSIQSISKPFTYGLALEDNGINYVASKVGVEPSGEAFNSISLDPETGRPLNPMINAGAITSVSMVKGLNKNRRLSRILNSYSKYTGHELFIDERVYQSESSTGYRNRAIAYMLRHFSILEEEPTDILELYFQQCAISVTALDLAMMAATLAKNGINPVTGVTALKSDYVEKVLSVMSTCGMYDFAGSWIYDVGMPAKSGVAGGVIAVLPGQFGIAIYSPPLDEKGNSVRGIAVCKQISKDYSLHILNINRVSYSVIRAKYDASSVSSNKLRNKKSRETLKRIGARIKVWELHGTLIFGSAEYVISDIYNSIELTQYFILDLRRVIHIEQAASKLLISFYREMQRHDKIVLFTCLDGHAGFVKEFKQHISRHERGEALIFADRHLALEWCENILLDKEGVLPSLHIETTLCEQELCSGFNDTELKELASVVKAVSFNKGDVVFQESDNSNALYFITRGEVGIYLEAKDSKKKRISTLCNGMAFGEMALVDKARRSATIICETEVSCLCLSFDDIRQDTYVIHRKIREKLLANLSLSLARKLRAVNKEIQFYY